ncbi:hypothetical protein, partial [Neptuniibacter marinus]|uniref:hypothetical protein n=1 Tax=Neptuniibacter marinus TaxID=1806670 RepID=UPI001E310F09
KSLWMVTFLQRTFTSLVHAHAGRTQEKAIRRLRRGCFGRYMPIRSPRFSQSTFNFCLALF